MRKTIKVCLFIALVSLVVCAAQVQEGKAPISGRGCANVTNKLKNLTVGKMVVKKCCGGIALIAQVKQQEGKKSVEKWIVQDSNGNELRALKGPVEQTGDEAIQTEDKAACFIIAKKRQ